LSEYLTCNGCQRPIDPRDAKRLLVVVDSARPKPVERNYHERCYFAQFPGVDRSRQPVDDRLDGHRAG
jgi:hypothetical protein